MTKSEPKPHKGNILMISYYYPPIGGTGIVRTLKYSKYLPEFGWRPHVLTVRNRDRFSSDVGSDQVPESVEVYRSWNILNNLSILEGGLRKIGISSRLLVPDIYIGWIPHSIHIGKKIIQENAIDAIYVSCPPFSSALIGARLKKEAEIPLIIDFRDAWTMNPYTSRWITNSLGSLDAKLEEYALKSADYVITATKGICLDYQTKYPFIKSKSSAILNGFDPEDVPVSEQEYEKFTIVYTGFFYGSRSPEPLFAALSRILSNGLIPENDIQFVWAGRNARFVHELAEKYNVGDIFRHVGLVSKKEADSMLYRSHLLFFVIGDSGEESQNTTLTGKLFPYLATGKPILAIVPKGSAREMLEKYAVAPYLFSSEHTDAIADAIVESYNKYKAGIEVGRNERMEEFYHNFSQLNLTSRLSGIFNHVTHRK